MYKIKCIGNGNKVLDLRKCVKERGSLLQKISTGELQCSSLCLQNLKMLILVLISWMQDLYVIQLHRFKSTQKVFF